LCAHVAWRTNRAYVFQEYYWEKNHFPWKTTENPRTPFNALVAGPVAGGPWGAGDKTPRSISAAWFDIVCPREKRKIVSASLAKNPVRYQNGDLVMNMWIKTLNDIPDGCVEVVPGEGDNFPQAFDLWCVRVLCRFRSSI